jgi:ADP-ribose pyrophosphatase YjhB (NUDIX family)
MSLAAKSQREVRRRLDHLQERYGPFTIEAETVTNDPEFFEQGRELVAEGWIGDAGAWVTDDEDRVLLVRHEGSPEVWGTPGGGHEPGERLEETARREVREETGAKCTLTGVYWARHKTVVLETDPDQRFHMLTVEFEADYDGGDISVGDDEILEARWFTDPPETVGEFLDAKVQEWGGSR